MYFIYISLIILIYINISYITYVPNYNRFYISWMDSLCDVMKNYNNPEFLIARKHVENGFTDFYDEYNINTCDVAPNGEWEFLYRPIFGDHIHLGYSLYLNDKPITLRDHNMSHNVKYEDYLPSCPNPPKYAYVKKWYHTGVHTHCDNIIHVHPFSAPRELRVEGKKVNLGIWFENVGIFYHPSSQKFEIPGHGLVKLKMTFFAHVTDKEATFITSDPIKILNTWLVDHQAFISLSNTNRWYKDKKVLNYKKYPSDYPKRKF